MRCWSVLISKEVQFGEDDELALRLGGEGGGDLVREGRHGFTDEARRRLGCDEGKGALHGYLHVGDVIGVILDQNDPIMGGGVWAIK